ncbi:MAG: NAD(P)-dependent oxidoreductase [Acetobacteraceae bacterium]|nr:NAD(P)-dependent oxidoreductase [Acetobacteraceae bacterium]
MPWTGLAARSIVRRVGRPPKSKAWEKSRTMSAKAHVGLVGVGLMGHGIASNILKHGYALRFLDHPGNQPVADLVAKGAAAHASGADLAAHCDIVVLCVTGTPQVEDALFRPDGVVAGMKPGTIVIDCSTAIPASTRTVAARIAAAGGRFLDAAMTRTPKEAAEGRLNLIVGAPDALLQEVLPLLRSFAENIAHAGPVGAGHQLKLLHNFVSLGFSAVLAEAAAAARRADVPAEVFVEVLAKGGGAGVILDRMKPFMLAGDASGFTFTLANALKDLTYYNAMTSALGAANGVAQAAQALYAGAVEHGHQARPVPELVTILSDGPGSAS